MLLLTDLVLITCRNDNTLDILETILKNVEYLNNVYNDYMLKQ